MTDGQEADRRRRRALSIGALWAPSPWYILTAVALFVCGMAFYATTVDPRWLGPATGAGFVALAVAMVSGFMGLRSWLHHVHHDPEWNPAPGEPLAPKQRAWAALGAGVPDYFCGFIAMLVGGWCFDLASAVPWLNWPAGLLGCALLALGLWFFYRAVRGYFRGLKGQF